LENYFIFYFQNTIENYFAHHCYPFPPCLGSTL